MKVSIPKGLFDGTGAKCAPGWHEATCTSAEAQVSRAGNRMIVSSWRVAAGGAEHAIKSYTVIDNAYGVERLVDLEEAAGISLFADQGDDRELDLDAMVGAKCQVLVEEAEDSDFKSIGGFRAAGTRPDDDVPF